MFETLEIDEHTVTLSKDEFLELLEYAKDASWHDSMIYTGKDGIKTATDNLDIKSVIGKLVK